MFLFETFIYQPFFNLLLAFYYGLSLIPDFVPDMGLAVVLLTLVIRVLLLPLSLASTRTRKERHLIQENINSIQRTAGVSPEKARQEIRKTFKSNRRILLSEGLNFFIQMLLFIVLYRIFTTGLKGDDLNLMYDFMPEIPTPFNLTFLGIFDLSKPSFTLNLIQSLVILAVEVIGLIDSPFPSNRGDFIRYVIILPLASFLIFMTLPAGKKLFIITTLVFSFFFILTNVLTRVFTDFFVSVEKAQAKAIEKRVVDPTPPDAPASV